MAEDLGRRVAARVRAMRRKRGWSQETLAEQAGLSRDAVSRIERGDREPRLTTLALLAESLGTDLAALFSFAHEPALARPTPDRRLVTIARCLEGIDPWLGDVIVAMIQSIARTARDAPGTAERSPRYRRRARAPRS